MVSEIPLPKDLIPLLPFFFFHTRSFFFFAARPKIHVMSISCLLRFSFIVFHHCLYIISFSTSKSFAGMRSRDKGQASSSFSKPGSCKIKVRLTCACILSYDRSAQEARPSSILSTQAMLGLPSNWFRDVNEPQVL